MDKNESSTSNFVGSSIPRVEDAKLLTGKACFIADISLPNMVHAAFLRSPLAHAHIRAINKEKAEALEGVVSVITGQELQETLPKVQDQQLPLPAKWRSSVHHKIFDPKQPLLAFDKVRHVGEALAVVLANDRYIAEDALELIEVTYEPLDPIVDPFDALREDSPPIHPEVGSNLLAQFAIHKGNVKSALEKAPYRIQRRFYHHRYAGVPMECRGVIAIHEAITDELTVWSSTQVPHWVKKEVSQSLQHPEEKIRCIAPDVGGGFGTKGHVYPEDILIPHLSIKINRPVRWVEDRSEHFKAACHSRDQWHDVEVGFDSNGRILAFDDTFVMDCGAWNPVGVGIPYNTACHLPGPYKIPNISVSGRVVATNKTPNAPYRGAGRPEAAQVTERVMDIIAKSLSLEPSDVRLNNMIDVTEMPYETGLIYRDGESIIYDSGNYPKSLNDGLNALGGIEKFRNKQRQAREQGEFIGLGICAYTEGTGVGPFEGATVKIDVNGKLHVTSGACSQGQGMETIYAQIAADFWKMNLEDVSVKLGDTSEIEFGFGTIASRSTVNVSAALTKASEILKNKILAIAAHMLEASPNDLSLVRGGVSILGVPTARLSLGEIARASGPGWGHKRPEGISPGLKETFYWEPPTVTWANAVHLAEVKVDINTGSIDITRYVVSHDCGKTINPMLATGQIVGGTAQGIGGAMYEEIKYDESGQPKLSSFMDYLIPSCCEIPPIEVIHQESLSPLNPLGVKGLGEGGAIGPPVAIANAVCDALREFNIELNETPVTPRIIVEKVIQAIDRNAP